MDLPLFNELGEKSNIIKFTNDSIVNKSYGFIIKHSGNILKFSSNVADKNLFLVIWVITLEWGSLYAINLLCTEVAIKLLAHVYQQLTKENQRILRYSSKYYQKTPCLLVHLLRGLILNHDSNSFNPLLIHFNLP